MGVSKPVLEYLAEVDGGQLERVRTFDMSEATHADGRLLALAVSGIEAGTYTARCAVSGSALATLFERQPEPIVFAVMWSDDEEARSMPHSVVAWFAQDRRLNNLLEEKAKFVPALEKLAAPWWVSVPFTDSAYDLTFDVPGTREVWFLAKYEGEADVRVDALELFKVRRDP